MNPFTNAEKAWVQANMTAKLLLGLLEVLEDKNEFLEDADEDVILHSS